MTDHPGDQYEEGALPHDENTRACPDETYYQYNSGQVREMSTTPPSEEKCNIGGDDVCSTHNIKASIIYVSSKKWSLIKSLIKSTNSYGWRYQKVKKTI